MSRPTTLLTLATLCCAFVAALIVSAPAHACSPPPEGWQTRGAITFDQDIPTDGVVAFELAAWGSTTTDLVAVEVRDAQDAAVDGETSFIELDPGTPGPPGSESTYLVVWNPASALAAQETYQLSVQATHPYTSDQLTVDEDASFQAGTGPAGQLPYASIISADIDVTEERADFECCTDDSFCDSCGDCQRCWATGYEYRPQVSAELDLPSASPLAQQVYTEFLANGTAIDFLWDTQAAETLYHQFEESAAGPFCVQAVTISLATGDEIHSEEECFSDSDLPSYTPRQSTGEGPPPECAGDAGLADAGTMDVGLADTGTNDVGSPDASSSDGGGGGGCNQSGPARPLGVAFVFVLIGVGLLRRRV